MNITEDERKALDEAKVRLTMEDWLFISRLLIESIATAETMNEALPGVMRSTPLAYIRFVRQRLAALDAVLESAEQGNQQMPGLELDAAMQARYLEMKRHALQRIEQQMAGIDPDKPKPEPKSTLHTGCYL